MVVELPKFPLARRSKGRESTFWELRPREWVWIVQASMLLNSLGVNVFSHHHNNCLKLLLKVKKLNKKGINKVSNTVNTNWNRWSYFENQKKRERCNFVVQFNYRDHSNWLKPNCRDCPYEQPIPLLNDNIEQIIHIYCITII